MKVNLGHCVCGHTAADHFAKKYKCYSCECRCFLDTSPETAPIFDRTQRSRASSNSRDDIPIYPLEYLPPWTPELGNWNDPLFVEALLLALSQAVCDRTGRVDWLSRGAVGFVYLIEGNSREVKIGRALEPHKRLGELQMGNPNSLTIWKAIPAEDRMALEAYLHSRFASFRIRGEWFKLPVEEIRWLEHVSYAIGTGKTLEIIQGEDLRTDCCGEPHFYPAGKICPDDDLMRRDDDGNWFIIDPQEVDRWRNEEDID